MAIQTPRQTDINPKMANSVDHKNVKILSDPKNLFTITINYYVLKVDFPLCSRRISNKSNKESCFRREFTKRHTKSCIWDTPAYLHYSDEMQKSELKKILHIGVGTGTLDAIYCNCFRPRFLTHKSRYQYIPLYFQIGLRCRRRRGRNRRRLDGQRTARTLPEPQSRPGRERDQAGGPPDRPQQRSHPRGHLLHARFPEGETVRAGDEAHLHLHEHEGDSVQKGWKTDCGHDAGGGAATGRAAAKGAGQRSARAGGGRQEGH